MFSSYEKRYKHLSRVIDKQMQQHAVCNEDFNEIQQEMSVVGDTYSIAPCTQNLEQQDQAEGDQDLILILMKPIIYQMILEYLLLI